MGSSGGGLERHWGLDGLWTGGTIGLVMLLEMELTWADEGITCAEEPHRGRTHVERQLEEVVVTRTNSLCTEVNQALVALFRSICPPWFAYEVPAPVLYPKPDQTKSFIIHSAQLHA